MGWESRTPKERREYDHNRYMRQREERLKRMAEYRQEHREELARKRREKYRNEILERYDEGRIHRTSM
jgi:hypothetical protein